MLTASDGSTDGSNLAYLTQPERHRHFDPGLFDLLVSASAAPDWRRLETIEASGAIPNATYQNALLPDDVAGRSAFMRQFWSKITDADLIFFDPDNGLEVSVTMGRRNSSKYLYLNEVAEFYASGKSLLIYQHFPRIERKGFTANCIAKLQLSAPDADIRTFTTAHVVFFLLIHPSSTPDLAIAASGARTRWSRDFIVVQHASSEPPTP